MKAMIRLLFDFVCIHLIKAAEGRRQEESLPGHLGSKQDAGSSKL
jgi:hypothetical protein